MMFTLSEENYLKAIFHLQTVSGKGISTNAIAKKLETKASSVTDMIKKLADKEVLTYIKYQGVSLTDLGRKIALGVIRKHRLWEVFLVEKLNFSWDEVHDVAEQLEHIKSTKLINELDIIFRISKNGSSWRSNSRQRRKISKDRKEIIINFKRKSIRSLCRRE